MGFKKRLWLAVTQWPPIPAVANILISHNFEKLGKLLFLFGPDLLVSIPAIVVAFLNDAHLATKLIVWFGLFNMLLHTMWIIPVIAFFVLGAFFIFFPDAYNVNGLLIAALTVETVVGALHLMFCYFSEMESTKYIPKMVVFAQMLVNFVQSVGFCIFYALFFIKKTNIDIPLIILAMVCICAHAHIFVGHKTFIPYKLFIKTYRCERVKTRVIILLALTNLSFIVPIMLLFFEPGSPEITHHIVFAWLVAMIWVFAKGNVEPFYGLCIILLSILYPLHLGILIAAIAGLIVTHIVSGIIYLRIIEKKLPGIVTIVESVVLGGMMLYMVLGDMYIGFWITVGILILLVVLLATYIAKPKRMIQPSIFQRLIPVMMKKPNVGKVLLCIIPAVLLFVPIMVIVIVGFTDAALLALTITSLIVGVIFGYTIYAYILAALFIGPTVNFAFTDKMYIVCAGAVLYMGLCLLSYYISFLVIERKERNYTSVMSTRRTTFYCIIGALMTATIVTLLVIELLSAASFSVWLFVGICVACIMAQVSYFVNILTLLTLGLPYKLLPFLEGKKYVGRTVLCLIPAITITLPAVVFICIKDTQTARTFYVFFALAMSVLFANTFYLLGCLFVVILTVIVHGITFEEFMVAAVMYLAALISYEVVLGIHIFKTRTMYQLFGSVNRWLVIALPSVHLCVSFGLLMAVMYVDNFSMWIFTGPNIAFLILEILIIFKVKSCIKFGCLMKLYKKAAKKSTLMRFCIFAIPLVLLDVPYFIIALGAKDGSDMQLMAVITMTAHAVVFGVTILPWIYAGILMVHWLVNGVQQNELIALTVGTVITLIVFCVMFLVKAHRKPSNFKEESHLIERVFAGILFIVQTGMIGAGTFLWLYERYLEFLILASVCGGMQLIATICASIVIAKNGRRAAKNNKKAAIKQMETGVAME